MHAEAARRNGLAWEADGDEGEFLNHGRSLPYWFDTRHPDAVRGTKILRTIDREFIVGFDNRRASLRFEVYGPSPALGGWVPVFACRDDQGRDFRPPVPWEVIRQAIQKALEEPLTSKQVMEMQEAAAQARRRAASDADGEMLRYYLSAFGRAMPVPDEKRLHQAFGMANEGRTKLAPEGLKAYYPGQGEVASKPKIIIARG